MILLCPLVGFLLISPYFTLAHFTFMETIPSSLVLSPVTLQYSTICLTFYPGINLLFAFSCSMYKIK